MYSKPGLIIWSMTIVCVALAAAALVNLLDHPEDGRTGQAVAILLLCGLAALFSVWRIVRLYRTAGEAADIKQVAFGVPIRPSRRKALAVGIVVLAIGALPLLLMNNLTSVGRGGAWLCVLTGAGVMAAVAAGVLPIGYIAFREDGLVIATRGSPLVLPWERIRSVEGGEFGGSPAFFLWLDEPETIPVPPAKQEAFLRQVAFCRQFMECDYYHPTLGFGIGLPSFVAAIEHYRTERTSVV